MPWSEDDIVLISALQHYVYCPRQCALIHLDRTYEENLYTLRGSRTHERVDSRQAEGRPGVRIERSIPLWNDELGIRGRSDVVEFHDDGPVVPIEYKSGKLRSETANAVQLCAEAMCLEWMLNIEVREGFLYYARSNRRKRITLDSTIRAKTKATIAEVRALLAGSTLPPPVADARCPPCSLEEACLPRVVAGERRGDGPAR